MQYLYTDNNISNQSILAMATVKEVYSGDDLMIFDGETNKSWAWAQSHSLSVNIDVVERNTKDNPKSPIKEVSKITYEITTENLFCEDFNTLFAKMILGEPITVKFGKKKNEGDKLPSEGDIEAWTLDGTQNYYVGKFLITSLQSNASTGEDATYTATFSGCGRIEQKCDIHTRIIPLDEWTTENRTALAGVTNDTLIQLENYPSSGATANWDTWEITGETEPEANGTYMGIVVMLTSVGAYYTNCRFYDVEDPTSFKTVKIEFDMYCNMSGTRQITFADGSTYTFDTTHKFKHVAMEIVKTTSSAAFQLWDCPNLPSACTKFGYKNFKITYSD